MKWTIHVIICNETIYNMKTMRQNTMLSKSLWDRHKHASLFYLLSLCLGALLSAQLGPCNPWSFLCSGLFWIHPLLLREVRLGQRIRVCSDSDSLGKPFRWKWQKMKTRVFSAFNVHWYLYFKTAEIYYLKTM